MVSFGNVKLLLKDGTDALDINNRSNLNASGYLAGGLGRIFRCQAQCQAKECSATFRTRRALYSQRGGLASQS
jgi:hypothetical protein